MSVTSCELPQVYEDCTQELEYIGITSECESVIEEVLGAAASSTIMHTQPKHVEYDGLALNQNVQEYKQLLWAMKDENTLLKVRLRRMEASLKKKNKIVDTHYLGQHNKLLYQEAVHQFTQRFEILQEENKDLKDELNDRDITIRKLRKQLCTYAAYKPASQKSYRRSARGGSASTMDLRASEATVRSKDNDPDSEDSVTNSAAILSKLQLTEISNNNEDLISFEDTNAPALCAIERDVDKANEEEHDTDRAVSCSLLLDTPHEEIEKLHSGFKDIITEVGRLKQSVGEIHEKHARTVSEMRVRERDMLARLYDKEHELAYRNLQKPPGLRQVRQTPAVATGEPERPQRRSASAFARLPPRSAAKAPATKQKGKKRESFAIHTASKSSLHDEIDMRLYIDEVLNQMNRTK